MSTTLNASTLLAVPLAPLAGAVIAGIFGTIRRQLDRPARCRTRVTILGVLVAFVISAHDAQERGARRRALQRDASTSGWWSAA